MKKKKRKSYISIGSKMCRKTQGIRHTAVDHANMRVDQKMREEDAKKT